MLDLHRGASAEQLLATPSFQSRWRNLSAACPWATMYQDVAFVTIWYASYRDEFEPLVVCESDE